MLFGNTDQIWKEIRRSFIYKRVYKGSSSSAFVSMCVFMHRCVKSNTANSKINCRPQFKKDYVPGVISNRFAYLAQHA